MGAFDCPTCKVIRHIDEDHDDPRKDHCWLCGTRVPYTKAELARMNDELAECESR